MNFYLDALKNYAKFSGRARRSEFWYFSLINMVIAIILSIISSGLSNIFCLLITVPSLAVGTRRMHDVGKNGWYQLIPLYSLYLVCLEGEAGTNQYGENPKK